MSVDGGGQVKPVLLGYTRYVLASSCAARRQSFAAVVPRIFIESGCRCYFRRRPDACSSSCLRAAITYRNYGFAESVGLDGSQAALAYFRSAEMQPSPYPPSASSPRARNARESANSTTMTGFNMNARIFSKFDNFSVGTIRETKPPPWMSSRRRCKR